MRFNKLEISISKRPMYERKNVATVMIEQWLPLSLNLNHMHSKKVHQIEICIKCSFARLNGHELLITYCHHYRTVVFSVHCVIFPAPVCKNCCKTAHVDVTRISLVPLVKPGADPGFLKRRIQVCQGRGSLC